MPHSCDAFDATVRSILEQLRPPVLLDIGCGAGKYGQMAFDRAAIRIGVEPDAAYIDQFSLAEHYERLIMADAITLIDKPRERYDLVIMGDVIEHMRKSAAIDLLNFLIYRSGYIIIVTPEGFIQDDWYGHVGEAHISTWSARDFEPWPLIHRRVEHPSALMHLFVIRGYHPARVELADLELP